MIAPDDEVGICWWNSLAESERASWLTLAGSAVPADAWDAFKLQAWQDCPAGQLDADTVLPRTSHP